MKSSISNDGKGRFAIPVSSCSDIGMIYSALNRHNYYEVRVAGSYWELHAIDTGYITILFDPRSQMGYTLHNVKLDGADVINLQVATQILKGDKRG